MMKILLVLPPSPSALKSVLGVGGVPLGLGYIASALEHEHDVKIIDAITCDYDVRKLRDAIERFDPDVVGVSSTTPAIYGAYDVAGLAKEVNPNCTTILGGPHPTFAAHEIMEECEYVDVVVRGEGEETIKEVVGELDGNGGGSLKEVKGITFREGKRIIDTENRPLIKNLDEVPFPAYHLMPMNSYRFRGKRFGAVITSRGCPFRCTFCSSSQLYGKTWRARSPENIVQELRVLTEDYGVKEIEFLDDTFTLDKNRAKKFCDMLMKEGVDISWSCSSRVDTMDKEVAKKLKGAGCHTVYVGVESGSQRTLNLIQKGITLSQVERAIKTIKEAGLGTLCSFIIGIPGETKKAIERTIEFAKKLSPNFAQFTICTPFPGTRLFEMAKEKNLLLTKDWSKFTTLEPVMRVPGLSAELLKDLMKKAYIKFYLRPSFVMREIFRGRIFLIREVFSAARSILWR